MVLLTMTPAVVWALVKAEETAPEDFGRLQTPSEPSLAEPKAGNPVSHSQLINLSKLLKKYASETLLEEEDAKETPTGKDDQEPPEEEREETEHLPMTLDALLRGSRIYIPPPPPKPEPSSEYKALMARLRAEEEARAYERMLNPNPLTNPQTFAQRFPSSQFSIGADPSTSPDELSYEEVHRQIILIINVLVSIIACAVFIWVAARHWSVPKRLGLSMGGSGAVAIAEVAVYSGYVRRVAEAKKKEMKKPEIKEIVQSWVIESSDKKEVGLSSGAKEKAEDGVRYRKGKHR